MLKIKGSIMRSLKLAGILSVALFLALSCTKKEAPKTEAAKTQEESGQLSKMEQITQMRQEWLKEFDEQTVNDPPPEPTIVLAADSGNFEGVMYYLQHGSDVNEPGQYGFSALHRAAATGDNRLVKYLLAKGADANMVNSEDGFIPLHNAALGGDSLTVELLMQCGAIHYARDNNGLTPMHCAAMKSNISAADALLRNGANINDMSESQWTPMRIAVYYKLEAMQKWLAVKGAKVEHLNQDTTQQQP